MSIAVRLRRIGFRVAYRGLQAFWFVWRPQTQGVKCLLTSGELILLVRHTYGRRRQWELPGGAVKRREPPVRAAAREMYEELGVRDADWKPAGMLHGRQSFRDDTIHCFQAELASTAVRPNLAELSEARWFPLWDLPTGLGSYARAVLDGTLVR